LGSCVVLGMGDVLVMVFVLLAVLFIRECTWCMMVMLNILYLFCCHEAVVSDVFVCASWGVVLLFQHCMARW